MNGEGLVERLETTAEERARLLKQATHGGWTNDLHTLHLLHDFDRLAAQVAKYQARLEIDYAFRSVGDGPLERYEIPPEERDSHPDGIECRDETIKTLRAARNAAEAERDALAARNAKLQADIAPLLARVKEAEGKVEEAGTIIFLASLHPVPEGKTATTFPVLDSAGVRGAAVEGKRQLEQAAPEGKKEETL